MRVRIFNKEHQFLKAYSNEIEFTESFNQNKILSMDTVHYGEPVENVHHQLGYENSILEVLTQ